MDDPDAPCGGGKVVSLRPTTIDDGEIRLGPVRRMSGSSWNLGGDPRLTIRQ
jgi:hypothetical protein